MLWGNLGNKSWEPHRCEAIAKAESASAAMALRMQGVAMCLDVQAHQVFISHECSPASALVAGRHFAARKIGGHRQARLLHGKELAFIG